MFTGKVPTKIAGRDVDQQLTEHYKYLATHDPEIKDPFKAVQYIAHRDEERAKIATTAHDDSIASSELWGQGKLTTATEVHRAQQKGDTKEEAAVVDGVTSNAELGKDEKEFRAKYGKDMLATSNAAKYEAVARLAKLQGDERPIQDIERELAHDDLDASELKIANTREYGAKPERSADLEIRLQRELTAKQHSGSLDAQEQMRAALGGNTGTEDLAREQLAVADEMLVPPKDPLGVLPRELKPGVEKQQFDQIDKNLSQTLEVQRDEKIRLSEHLAKIYSTIGKIAALVTAQPELFALIDVASGLATMAIKKSVAGEAYDPADDAKLLAIDAAVDVAMVGLVHAGTMGIATAATEKGTQLGRQTATESSSKELRRKRRPRSLRRARRRRAATSRPSRRPRTTRLGQRVKSRRRQRVTRLTQHAMQDGPSRMQRRSSGSSRIRRRSQRQPAPRWRAKQRRDVLE